ncbi:acetylcholinesterase-like [Ptychodera flava]|uniref:acetylcholinesterase-like n=1 Tax=Ptychodera flava TaxID=63121 RepID=UPI00396A68D3
MYIHIAIGLAFYGCVAADAPVVEVTSGRVAGTTVEFSHPDVATQRTVNIFRGIPYAEPPLGQLRFQPPQGKTAWEGVYDATEFRPICPQPVYNLLPESEPQSEDCLFLNVYAPQTQSGSLPVMVWIHGGGFLWGSGSSYDSLPLSAIGNVIVVTINYRLGALGFFLTGDEHATGNYGLLDQIAALQWVQDNIAAFGGDANRVTIFGESAGSISVDFLLFSPLAEGLFERAIMQSGTATMPSFPLTDKALQNRIAHGLGKVVGCEDKTSEELVTCLRTVQAEDFNDPSNPATNIISDAIGEQLEEGPFAPFVDGTVLPENPKDVVAEGRFSRTGIDILMGANADEGTFVLAELLPYTINQTVPTVSKSQFDVFFPVFLFDPAKSSSAAHDAVKLMYVDWATVDSDDANYAQALSQMIGDQMFVCPTDLSARAYSEAGSKVYRYFMTHVPATSVWPISWMGAAHYEDIQFVFGYHFLNLTIMPQEEINMTLQIMKYWTNFAKTGNPNLPSTGNSKHENWALFHVPGLAYKELSVDMETKYGHKTRECALWNDYIPSLIKRTENCDECASAAEDTSPSVFVVGFITSLLYKLFVVDV